MKGSSIMVVLVVTYTLHPQTSEGEGEWSFVIIVDISPMLKSILVPNSY